MGKELSQTKFFVKKINYLMFLSANHESLAVAVTIFFLSFKMVENRLTILRGELSIVFYFTFRAVGIGIGPD